MRRPESKPTIRILILGAAGVGKNCLESRFTTSAYPPLYDPALTLSSRRYLTLSPRPSSPPEPTTRPLNTSYGLPTLKQAAFGGDFFVTHQEEQAGDRPGTASSTFSNPASLPMDGGVNQAGAPADDGKRATAAVDTTRLSVNGDTTTTSPSSKRTSQPISTSQTEPTESEVIQEPQPAQACPECQREARTYLVELTNYPALRARKVRSAVLAKGEYDAVVLVYDVGSRASFEVVAGLAGEIPRCRRWRGMRRRESVGEGLDGLAAGGVGRTVVEKLGRKRLRRRRSVAVGMDGKSSRVRSSMGFRASRRHGHRNGEPVVALVGNKADFDAEYASADFMLEAKRAALEEVDVEERGLMHPLFRESQLYREENDDIGVAVEGARLSRAMLRPGAVKRDTFASSYNSIRPLLSPYSGRSFAVDGRVREITSPGEPRDLQADAEWPLTRNLGQSEDIKEDEQNAVVVDSRPKPNHTTAPATRTNVARSNLDFSIRRSAMSADYHVPTHRISVLSKRSVRTMQEGSKPLILTKLPKSEAVENWIRTGSPTTAEYPDEELHNDENGETVEGENQMLVDEDAYGRDGSYSTTTTTAPKRRVSRLEGEMLARTLLLDVPFYETSARTGENVEEMFEAVVREVLRGQGRDAVPDPPAVYAQCKRKHGWKQEEVRKSDVVQRVKTEKRTNRNDGRRASWPEIVLDVPSTDDKKRLVVDAELNGVAVDTSEAEGPVTPERMHTRRPESMLDRFRKVFSRKSVVMVADVATAS